MDRRLQPIYQVHAVSIQVLVSADLSVVTSKRRMSLTGPAQQSTNVTPSDTRYRRMSLAIGVSPYSSVLGKKARDGRRRQSESTNAADPTVSDPALLKARRMSNVVLPPAFQVVGKSRRQSTVFLPLAEAITREHLVLEGLDKVLMDQSTYVSPSDSPDQAAIARHIQPNSQVQPVSTPGIVSADRNVVPTRRVSFACAISPDTSILGKKARDGLRRQSESVDATGHTVNYPISSKSRRMSTVTLPPEFQVVGRTRKLSTVFRPVSFQREPLGEVSNSLPLAEAIMKGESSEKELLVSEEMDKFQKEQADPQWTLVEA